MRNSRCMAHYLVFMFMWTLIFMTLGIVTSLIAPDMFDKNNPSKCAKTPTFQRIQSYYEQAQKSICYSCNCYFPNSDNFKIYSAADLTRIALTDAPLLSMTNKSYPVRAQ